MSDSIIKLLSVLCAFAGTWILLAKGMDRLPRDHGREFAVNGALSVGKPRGAGVVFVTVMVLVSLIFAARDVETVVYLVLLFASMLTGYLDDAAKVSWGELKKGILDFLIAVLVAATYLYFNGNSVTLALTGTTFTIPAVLYGFLIVVLVWVSINVTNCSDGVDGLSGSMAMVTMMSFYFMDKIKGESGFGALILIFVFCILAYQWFNATPSKLMMGDAGSRAMGFFIAVAALKSGCPFMYIPFGIMLILDGGLGLFKVSCIRFLHLNVMSNIRTPIHDHVRKNMDWSNTQCVFRFAILQLVVSMLFICLVK